MKKVNSISYHTKEGTDFRQVDFLSVIDIVEHNAQGDGDKWYYDIIHKNGTVCRVFEPIIVVFEPVEESDSQGRSPR